MALLIDTTNVPAGKRNDAISSVLSGAFLPTRASHDVPDELINNKTHSWTMGPRNDLVRIRDNALRLSRAASDNRPGDRELFAMTYQHRGTSYFLEDNGAKVERAGTLFMQDVTCGFEFAFGAEGDISSFVMTHADLGLPYAFVETASRRLESSSLYRLVRADFARLSHAARDLSEDEKAAGLLAAATVSLTRALLASTDPDNPRAREAIEDALPDTISLYIRHHLSDASLTVEGIASANHVSIRLLRQLWAAAGEDLEPWILRQRLRAARKDVDASATPRQAADAIAHRWGFTDPTTFKAHYRDEFGSYPGD
jgi:AraC-like DNA-binding protein